jgi:hypothetical protein
MLLKMSKNLPILKSRFQGQSVELDDESGFFPVSALPIESLMPELFSYIDQFNCCFTAGLGQRYRTYRQSICLPPTILACNVRFVPHVGRSGIDW